MDVNWGERINCIFVPVLDQSYFFIGEVDFDAILEKCWSFHMLLVVVVRSRILTDWARIDY